MQHIFDFFQLVVATFVYVRENFRNFGLSLPGLSPDTSFYPLFLIQDGLHLNYSLSGTRESSVFFHKIYFRCTFRRWFFDRVYLENRMLVFGNYSVFSNSFVKICCLSLLEKLAIQAVLVRKNGVVLRPIYSKPFENVCRACVFFLAEFMIRWIIKITFFQNFNLFFHFMSDFKSLTFTERRVPPDWIQSSKHSFSLGSEFFSKFLGFDFH